MWATSASVTGWRGRAALSSRMPKSGSGGMPSSARIARSPSGSQDIDETVTARPATTGT